MGATVGAGRQMMRVTKARHQREVGRTEYVVEGEADKVCSWTEYEGRGKGRK